MIKISKKLLIAGLSVSLLLASGGIANTANAQASTTNQASQQTQRVVNQYHGNVPKWKQVGTAGYTVALQQHNQQVQAQRAQQAKEAQRAQASKSVAQKPVAQSGNQASSDATKPVYTNDSANQKKTLPQTGESTSHKGVIASALATVGALFGAVFLRKRNQD